MNFKRSLGFFGALVFVCAVSHSAFCTVEEEVAKVLDKALDNKVLFELKEGQKKKRSNLYAFYYEMPQSISDDADLAWQFIDCLRKTVQEDRLVGPNQRPLALIKKSNRVQKERPVKKNKTSTSFSGSKSSNDDMAY